MPPRLSGVNLAYTLQPTPCTLHPTPCTLHPTPYTLHPAPHTLRPTPHTPHPAPYTLHPTPYALQCRGDAVITRGVGRKGQAGRASLPPDAGLVKLPWREAGPPNYHDDNGTVGCQ